MSSLVVNTNMSAIQTLNDLNATDNSLTTAVNRLSSGLQIESAATGPAQYVISQALESQANGYGTAIDNAQDGVSMIQTASGALTQISSILQTMEQLALTSSNAATQTTTSLQANSSEFTDLLKSITEIAETTTFGTKQLLVGNGTVNSTYTGVLQIGAFDATDQRISFTITAVTSTTLTLKGTVSTLKSAATAATKSLATATKSITIVVGSETFKVAFGATTTTMTAVAAQINKVAGSVVTASVVATYTTTAKETKYALTISSKATGATATFTVNAAKTVLKDLGLATSATTLSLSSATEANSSVSIATSTKAQAAVAAVQTAISKVDEAASTVGAVQNELQAIVSNLTVGQQNLQAADSQLVDVNMAQEMTTYSTDNILMQSGVSMLAQAQQLPSLVLKLMGA